MAANTPSSMGGSSLTGEPTAAYRPRPDPPRARPRPAPVALVAGTGLQPAEEIQRLLRRRLGIIVLILLGFYAAQVSLAVLALLRGVAGPEFSWPGFGFYGLILATASLLAKALWSTRPLSFRSLRAIELVIFLLLAVFGAWMMQDELRSQWARQLAAESGLGQLLLSRAHALNWFALIVVYGTFIPNTWRRCAAVTGAMGLTPLAVSAAVGQADGRPGGQADLAVWMATAVAIAVYGSHRIEVLRQQAAEARKLGQYQLKRRLGAGGMGEVYLAEHVLLRRPCALKLIRPERAGDPKDLARFEREVQATATLTHPNTVQIFDYGQAEDGTFYYVMEYLAGMTLDQLVKDHGPLPSGRAVHFLRQVCGALQEAHRIGLIHRDVKPSNVMVCSRGGAHDTAKLLDFGLVQPAMGGADGERLTLEGVVTGTPAYLSPEQAAGQGGLDARSDIYSVGALAYYLLTGRPPFPGRSVVQMLAAHLYECPESLSARRPDVPADLEAVVLRCLAKAPADRFPDAQALAVALAHCSAAGEWSEPEAARWWRDR